MAGTLTVNGSLSLQEGAAAELGSGSLSVSSATVDASSAVTGNGTIAGPVIDDGAITALASDEFDSTLTIAGPVTGTGTLVIAADPLLGSHDPDFFCASSALALENADSVNIRFGNANGFLELDHPQEFTGTITLAATQDGPASNQSTSPPYLGEDDILLGGVSVSNVTGVTHDGDVLTVGAGSQTVSLHIVGDLSQDAIEIYGFGTLPNGEPSVILHTTPDVVPTLSLDTPGGGVPFAIVNTVYPRVSGTATSGMTVDLTADEGSNQEGFGYSYAPSGQPIGSFDTALNGLTLGLHEVDAEALTTVGNLFAASVDVFVLPGPVDGITTAAVSFFQLGSYLDSGASMNFVASTEAIQLTDGTLSVGDHGLPGCRHRPTGLRELCPVLVQSAGHGGCRRRECDPGERRVWATARRGRRDDRHAVRDAALQRIARPCAGCGRARGLCRESAGRRVAGERGRKHSGFRGGQGASCRIHRECLGAGCDRRHGDGAL